MFSHWAFQILKNGNALNYNHSELDIDPSIDQCLPNKSKAIAISMDENLHDNIGLRIKYFKI